jgi:hypothetical protein
VFKKHGIVGEHEPVTDLQLRNKITGEITQRVALHALGLPYVENLTGEEIVARLEAVRDKAGDDEEH